MSDHSNYGDKFEAPLIVILSLVIIGMLVGTVALIKGASHDCRASDYTYCNNHHQSQPEH